MAYITLQFGQCGNQLGEEIFSMAFDDAVFSSTPYWVACHRDSWFLHTTNGRLKARAVLVDSEKKVLHSVQKKGLSWSYNKENVISENTGGSGNNFALGYCTTGPQVCDAVLEVLRRECERCDRVSALISLAACAGGTGSGAGTYVLEQVRDYYPNHNLISVLIMPYVCGEVVTQNNNILFTLTKQNDVCDSLVLFENELLSNMWFQRSRLKNTMFQDLNKIISQSMLSFLQPLNKTHSSVALYDLLSQISPISRYKLLSILSYPGYKEVNGRPEESPSWNILEREIIRTFRTSCNSKVDCTRAIANVVIARGQPAPESTVNKLKSSFIYPDWMPPNDQFHLYHQPRPLLRQEKSLSVISNNCKVTSKLDYCVAKAWKLFTNNMFVHHYYKYGISKEGFLEMFTKAESMLKIYSDL